MKSLNKTQLLLLFVMLGAGFAGGYWLSRSMAPQYAEPQTQGDASERKPLFYRNPMNPEIISQVPAKDHMGMDYIPVYADDTESVMPGTVSIDPVTVQNMGVRTAQAERRSLGHDVRAVGRVDYNEEHLARLSPKTEGWISAVHISNTGERVNKGTILLSLYSPRLVTSQQEYLLAMQNLEAMRNNPYPELRQSAEELAKAARARLELLDVPAHQVHELEQSRKVVKDLHIHSPFDGVLVSVGVRPGQYVTPETELYKIADLRNVWVYVDIYENEMAFVKAGDSAEMRLAGIPGRTFRGKVTYIYPYVDPKTRTVRLRLDFDNREALLKPDMYAEVNLQSGRRVEAVVVPAEAVVRSGARDQVFVVRAPGKFEPREVELGVSSEGWTEVISGISTGEEVVVSSQFLIDSESKLREVAAKLREPAAPVPDDDLDMSDMMMPEPPGEDPAPGHTGAHQHD